MTLIMLDLDNFKEVNDTRGHAVGDKILDEIGRRLTRIAPHAGIVARLGGDEFALLATGNRSDKDILENGQPDSRRVKPSDPRRVYAHLYRRYAWRSRASRPTRATRLSCSRRPISPSTPPRKHVADRSSSTRPSSTRFSSGTSRAIDMVRAALAEGDWFRSTSRKCASTTAACMGFEALARVAEPMTARIVTPSAFAAALDDRVVARRIGKKMLHAVTADIASWRDAGLEPHSVSLNVGEADFADGKLAQPRAAAPRRADVAAFAA